MRGSSDSYVTSGMDSSSELQGLLAAVPFDLPLREAMNLFITEHLPAIDRARLTQEAYQRDLEDLLRFLDHQGITNAKAVGHLHLETYLAGLSRQGARANTLRRRAFAIRAFFRYLEIRSNGQLPSPSARLIPPQAPTKTPRVLTEDECNALLRAC